MKSMIKNLTPAALLLLGLVSCSENSWNDHLDGFDGNQDLTDVKSLNYELTATDYGRFSNNRFNKQLAAGQQASGENPDAVKALAAVAANQYITSATPAAEYMPNLLNDSVFPYFSLSNGSAINLTYREVKELPAVMQALNGAPSYEVVEDDYKKVYGSNTDYAMSFAPSYAPAQYVPGLLATAYPNAKSGDYVIVKYNVSSQDPVFDAPAFEMSDVLKPSLATGDEVDVKGVVTAVCTRGFILSDKAGSILVYDGTDSFDATAYAVGMQVEVKATLASFKNCLQIAYADANIVSAGQGSVEYPAPVDLTPAYLKAANENANPVTAVYGYMTGTVAVSGNYININFDGVSDVRGSVYNATDEMKAKLTDGSKLKVYGYFTQTSVSKGTVNANLVVTNVESASKKAPRKATRVVTLPSTQTYAAYTFNGSRWSVANDILVVQPADYAQMGLTYGNMQDAQPAQYLPTFLSRTYPYAQADKEVYVCYRYYANKKTTNVCAQWSFDGSKWYDSIATNGVQTVTNQFVKRDGKWQMDPSVEITLPTGRGQSYSAAFYQKCVDWVIANVPDGSKYVTKYGNNDYYTGASAFDNNIDLRPGSARTQYKAAYADMTDEQIVATMKKRFEDEVCPGVLSELYPNMEPMGEFHPTVTIHFWIYTGTTHPETIVFECESKGKFKFVSCTWNDEAE